jgi:hypothetical protein
MAMLPTDTLVAMPRGTLQETILYFDRIPTFVARWPDFIDYCVAVFELAPRVGIDPSVVIAQARHETDLFRSIWWRERLNPAGIGITGDYDQNLASRTFRTGTESARAQIAHLLLYATGKISFPLSERDDPRFEAYTQANGTTARARTIRELAGSWAKDKEYHLGICRHGNSIFKNLPTSIPRQAPSSSPIRLHPQAAPIYANGILWDGARDARVNGILFHALRRYVTVGVDNLNIRVYADVTSHVIRTLHRGNKIGVVGWVNGEQVSGESRWWIGSDHTRIWVGGTVEKP